MKSRKLKIDTYGGWSTNDGDRALLGGPEKQNNEKGYRNYFGNGPLTAKLVT